MMSRSACAKCGFTSADIAGRFCSQCGAELPLESDAELQYLSGSEAMARGDNVRAARDLEMAADAGHVDAMVDLGLLKFQGGDSTSALRWWTLGASKGNTRSMLNRPEVAVR